MESISAKLRTYYQLAKPGIIYGNLVTAMAGFLFATGLQASGRVSQAGFDGQTGLQAGSYSSHFNLTIFAAVIIGTALVIGSACVFNNYTDRAIDIKMERTKKRALVQGDISPRKALVYAILLGIAGFAVLALYTNLLTVALEAIGFLFYTVFYGLSKRHTVHGVIVGSVSGAVPIVAGYCAMAGRFDLAALILFIILVVWQMPHFYAIALYRVDEYRAAGIPILPLRKGIRRTKIEMLVYTLLFFAAVLLLSVFGYAGYSYLFVMTIAAGVWIWLAIIGFALPMVGKSTGKLAEHMANGSRGTTTPDMAAVSQWARKMFFYSLIMIIVFSVMISVGALLP